MQTIAELFRTTRGGKYQKGRCEVCDEELTHTRYGLCEDCQYNNSPDEEE